MFTATAITFYILSAEFKFKNRTNKGHRKLLCLFSKSNRKFDSNKQAAPKIKHYADAKSYSIFKKQKNARTDLENDGIESP